MKLNVLLAKTDQLGAYYRGMLKDYMVFFQKKQGAFLGERKTYTAVEGMLDDPSILRRLLMHLEQLKQNL